MSIDPDFDTQSGKTPWVLLGNYTYKNGTDSTGSLNTLINTNFDTIRGTIDQSTLDISGSPSVNVRGFPLLKSDGTNYPIFIDTSDNAASSFVQTSGELSDTVPEDIGNGSFGHVSTQLYKLLADNYLTGGGYEFRFLAKYGDPGNANDEIIYHMKTDDNNIHLTLLDDPGKPNTAIQSLSHSIYDGVEINVKLKHNNTNYSGGNPTAYFGFPGDTDRTMFDGIIRETNANNIYFRFGFNNQYKPYTGTDITNKNMILQVWVRANS